MILNIIIGVVALVTLINILRAPKLFWLYMACGLALHIGMGLIFLFAGVDTSQVQTQGNEFEVWLFGGGMFFYGGACLFFNFVMLFIGLGDKIDEMAAEQDYKVQRSLRGSRFQPGEDIPVVKGEVVEERPALDYPPAQKEKLLPAQGWKFPFMRARSGAWEFLRTDCNCSECGRYDWCDRISGDVYKCDRCQNKDVIHSMQRWI